MDEFAINKITDIDEEKIRELSADTQTITDEAVQDACDLIQNRLEENMYDHTDCQK